MGRPSSYTPEIAAEICERLAGGESLLEICEDDGYPGESTVRAWALEDREGFSAKYARAREIGYHHEAEDLGRGIATVKPKDVPRARLEFDIKRWRLSKMLPKVYGDATLLKHADNEGNEFVVRVERIGDKPKP